MCKIIGKIRARWYYSAQKEAKILKRKRKQAVRRGRHFSSATANRNIKDGVFRLLFAIKENAAELYYALTGIKCSPDEIQIITIPDIISGKLKNDMAFVVRGKVMVISEHMSSPFLNIPVRILMYTGVIYENWFKINGEYKFLFGSKLYMIPTPELVLFYNGTEAKPEKETLRLSSAFMSPVDKNFGTI